MSESFAQGVLRKELAQAQAALEQKKNTIDQLESRLADERAALKEIGLKVEDLSDSLWYLGPEGHTARKEEETR